MRIIIFACMMLLAFPFTVVNAAEAEMTDAERKAFEKSLFEGRCQMCHQLPEPSMLRAKQWRLILGTMQQRMQQAGVPPLTEEETEMILEYIAEQSR